MNFIKAFSCSSVNSIFAIYHSSTFAKITLVLSSLFFELQNPTMSKSHLYLKNNICMKDFHPCIQYTLI